MDAWLYLVGITLLPYIELRGSIPVAIGLGLPPLQVFLVATFVNILIIYPAFIFLDWFFHYMERIPLFNKAISKTQKKAKPYVDKYGMLGLAVFVGVPLPGTGAYSGALAAHLFGIKNKRAIMAIALGVTAAGIMVTLISTVFKETLGWLV
ncbi:COG2426 family protein [Candidatus Altiarchaeota archaeon]